MFEKNCKIDTDRKMKLSIIIPVYNVEKYISKCLGSILCQNLDPAEYEIIIVNDGSPDDSKSIILEYQKKNKNIVFIDQENKGVSVARNRGLDCANGDYVLFIDPDDTLYENSIKPILEKAYQDNLDVLYLKLDLFDENGGFISTYEECGEENVISNGLEHPRRTYLTTLYRRKVIADIRYVEGITRGQDTVFNTMVQSVSQRCSYCAIPYYKYLVRNSSSRQFIGNEKAFKGCLKAISELEIFRKKHFDNSNEQAIAYFNKVNLIFVQRVLEWSVFPQMNRTRFNHLKSFLRENHFDELIKATAKKFKFFDKSFSLFYSYYFLQKQYNRVKQIGRR